MIVSKKKAISWICRDRTLLLGNETVIMGILNVTPDSFSDGGRYLDTHAAIARGLEIEKQGAKIIDIGGESSRPGAEPITAEEEIKRIIPVVEALRQKTKCLLSVDTTKAAVARAAMEMGAHIINDISALTEDSDMTQVALDYGAGVVLMHRQGSPQTMQINPTYNDVVADVNKYLRERIDFCCERGLRLETLAIDPGIGFGKTVEQNVQLLTHTDTFCKLGHPVLLGLSRKSFLGKLLKLEVQERGAASLGALAYAVLKGAHIMRVHDVKESCEVAGFMDMLRQRETTCSSSVT